MLSTQFSSLPTNFLQAWHPLYVIFACKHTLRSLATQAHILIPEHHTWYLATGMEIAQFAGQ